MKAESKSPRVGKVTHHELKQFGGQTLTANIVTMSVFGAIVISGDHHLGVGLCLLPADAPPARRRPLGRVAQRLMDQAPLREQRAMESQR